MSDCASTIHMRPSQPRIVGKLLDSSKAVELQQFVGGEKEAELEGGGVGGVGAVGAVVLDAGAKLLADGAGGGLGGVGGAHDLAPLGNRVLGFQRQHHHFAGAHEIGQVGEERPLAVDGVEAFGLGLREPQRLGGHDLKAGLMDALQNFARQAAADGVRFDDCQRSFFRHLAFPPLPFLVAA